jgi:hypothetical protein
MERLILWWQKKTIWKKSNGKVDFMMIKTIWKQKKQKNGKVDFMMVKNNLKTKQAKEWKGWFYDVYSRDGYRRRMDGSACHKFDAEK